MSTHTAASGAGGAGIERITRLVRERADQHEKKFGVRIISLLRPGAAELIGDAGEVNLLGEVVKDVSYFDLFEMEGEIGAALGLRTRIIVRRALQEELLKELQRDEVVL